MDPRTLIDTAHATELPAPYWFIELFKVLGFALHTVPMNLWYAGIVLAMVLYALGNEHGRRFSQRLMVQMPVIVAFGVNLGIVPLLFVQVAYAKLFYSATVLMAWYWLGIIALLIPAYYGVYFYAFGVRDKTLSSWRRAGGWLAALLLIAIGFIFANGMSLMANVGAWPQLFHDHNVAGAVTGTALNVADSTLWPRWLMMFGLALTTTATWVAFDAAWFGRGETVGYQHWAPRFAWKLQTLGILWFAVTGSWYVFGTWSPTVREAMFASPTIILTGATALAPGLPWLLLLKARRDMAMERPLAILLALAQFGVLGLNAISRQVVQNLELGQFYAVSEQPTAPQWSPMAMFLIAFVAGLALVVWMIRQAIQARPSQAA